MYISNALLVKMVRYCYVCKIGAGEKSDVSVHRLPKDEKTKASWFAFIGHKTGENGGICSKHFKQSDFIYKKYGNSVRRFLKPGSCPAVLPCSQNIRKNVNLYENTNNCILLRTEDDSTNLEKTDIKIKKEVEKCIIIDETVNIENSMDIQLKRETDDPLAIVEGDTNIKTSIILGNEVQESISIEETIINTNLIDIQLKRETDDPLAVREYNTYMESTPLENEIQQSINIDERIINSIDNQLKRKIDDSLATRKRFYHPRHIDDLCREDFTSDESWCLFKDYSKETKLKVRSLKKQIIYLNKKVNNLQEKVNHFKEIMICMQ